ncbi:MAG: SH3 domain-containing protein [Xenococcaceae cyanobacterium MO_188.B19]|nr:SH3 domain-containing protein [Xenococcaceae cyanobacterium MO_188.B19]
MTKTKQIFYTSLRVISNTLQFILGFVLGVSLIGGVAVGAGYYYFTKMSSSVPKKPVYEEETANKSVINKSQTEDSETIFADVPLFPGESGTAPEPEKIPNNAYYARVTWPQGLSVRAEPSLNSTRVGGVGYNAKILILEQSSDKKWQRIQIPDNKKEGWVKAGNVKRVPN